jgi:excisionase family DNA binding protein
MPEPALLSVNEAAERLGVTPVAVRQQIKAGRLPAVKRGRSWWVDQRDVQRSARQPAKSGRPLSPRMAWAVILLASGEPRAAGSIAPRNPARTTDWLRSHPLYEHASQLRHRAATEDLEAHPSELKRILERPDTLPSGISAGEAVGLIGTPSGVELYAPAARQPTLVEEHALNPAAGGPVRIRWVPDDLWVYLQPGKGSKSRAPRIAILLDLLESDDPRARREAARALSS